jgi:hypothetical protein
MHTRADDDAVFANAICERGSVHRQIPTRARRDEIGKAIRVCSVIRNGIEKADESFPTTQPAEFTARAEPWLVPDASGMAAIPP